MTNYTIAEEIFDTIHDINTIIHGKTVIYMELMWSQKDCILIYLLPKAVITLF